MTSLSTLPLRSHRPQLMVPALAVAAGALVCIPSAAPLVAPTALGTLLLAVLVHHMSPEDRGTRRALIAWTMGGLVFHLALALSLWELFGYLADDAPYYDDIAKGIMAHWDHGLPLPTMLTDKVGFFYLLAGLYKVFGASTETFLAVNSVFAAALVPVMSDATTRLFGARAGRDVCPLLVLTPGILIWTAMPLREAPVLFLIATLANCGVRLNQAVTPVPCLVFLSAAGGLYAFRPGAALTIGGGALAGIALAKGPRSGFPGGAAVACMVLVAGGIALRSNVAFLRSLDLKTINEVRAIDSATSTSFIAKDIDISTPTRAVAVVATRLPESFLGPYPWQVRNARHLLAIPDVVVGWCLLPLMYFGIRTARGYGDGRWVTLIVPAVLTQLMLCLIVGDFGTLLRQRPQVLLLLLPLAALGLSARTSSRRADLEPELDPGGRQR